MSADLSQLELAALMLDGVHFGEHTCIVALGIGVDGSKHPLALAEGFTENATLARELVVSLREPRTLRSTNPIESMISICRDHAINVKNWKNGQMALRWCAAGMAEAAKQFRRVDGFLHLPKLQAALQRHVAPQKTASGCYNENVA
ncbi:hypothetical protein Pta02_75210 [Planobispora takensis]|uniref:Uncharacterized protein n=1 Tax=Planobispora takensis TaxID=1367882 RepID=A0A8J3WY43_9ACTN|nr:hypothetical protein Pta02_75210 [Planobispora takensis]